MNRKQFAKFLARDSRCYHCGTCDDTLVPNHRSNRGMGGSANGDRPSNVVVLCSLVNGLIESDPDMADEARRRGWKLNSWEDPLSSPVFDTFSGQWFLLDDRFGRVLFDYPHWNG